MKVTIRPYRTQTTGSGIGWIAFFPNGECDRLKADGNSKKEALGELKRMYRKEKTIAALEEEHIEVDW